MREVAYRVLNELRRTFREGRLFAGHTFDLASGEKVQIVPRFLLQNASLAVKGERGFDLVVESLVQIESLAESNGVSCLVLLFPRKEEVYGQFLDEELPRLSDPVIAELERSGIDYLDLGPVFREQALEGGALFLEVDGHPTSLGYALVAQVVNDYLIKHESELGLDWDSTPFSGDAKDDHAN